MCPPPYVRANRSDHKERSQARWCGSTQYPSWGQINHWRRLGSPSCCDFRWPFVDRSRDRSGSSTGVCHSIATTDITRKGENETRARIVVFASQSPSNRRIPPFDRCHGTASRTPAAHPALYIAAPARIPTGMRERAASYAKARCGNLHEILRSTPAGRSSAFGARLRSDPGRVERGHLMSLFPAQGAQTASTSSAGSSHLTSRRS